MTSPNHSDVFAAFIEADAALKQVPALKTEIETLQSQLRHKEAEAEHWRTTADRTADKNAEQYEHIRSLEVERDEYGFRAIDAEDKLEKLSSLAGTVLASIKSSAPGGLSSKDTSVPAGVSSEAPTKIEEPSSFDDGTRPSRQSDSVVDKARSEIEAAQLKTYTAAAASASEARTDQGHDGLSDEGESQSGDTVQSSATDVTSANMSVDQRDIPPTASLHTTEPMTAKTENVSEPTYVNTSSHTRTTIQPKPYTGMLYRDWLNADEGTELSKLSYNQFTTGGGNGSQFEDDAMPF